MTYFDGMKTAVNIVVLLAISSLLNLGVQSKSFAQNSMIDSLERHLKQYPDDTLNSIVYSELGKEYAYVAPHKALNYATMARELAVKHGQVLNKAHALRTLASVNLILNNYVITSELLSEAIEIFESHGDEHGLGNCYISLGLANNRQKHYSKACEVQLQALAIFKKLDLPERQSVCYNNMAESYLGLKEYHKAIQYSDSSLQINVQLGNRSIMMSNYKNLGLIYAELGQKRESISYFNLVIMLSGLLKNKSNTNAECVALLQSGSLFLRENKEKSRDYYERALRLARSNGYDQHATEAYFGLYKYYNLQGLRLLADSFLTQFVRSKDSLLSKSIEQRSHGLEAIYKARVAEQEVEMLNAQKELQQDLIQNQQTLLAMLLMIVIGIGVFVVVLFRNNKRKVKTNQLLRKKNHEIIAQRDQIMAQAMELEKNRERLRDAQVIARLGGWEYDVEGDILEWYEETKDVFNRVESNTPNSQAYLDVIHPDDRSLFITRQKDLIKKQIPYQEVIRHKTNTGAYMHVQLNARPVVKGNRVVKILGVSLDVTDLVEYQKKLEGLVLKKDVILGVVAHDLRAPLNNIKGIMAAMDLKKEVTSEQIGFFNLIELAANRGLELISQLLDLSEVDDDQFHLDVEPTDLVPFVWDVIERIKSVTKDQRIQLVSQDSAVPTMVNRSRVIRVIENLVSNARKFTNETGKIVIRLTTASNMATLEIEDSGIGIPNKLHGILFDRFSKARRSGLKGEHSTGLGMSIVKRIIELHDGTIQFESKEGKGTIFYISIPMVKG